LLTKGKWKALVRGARVNGAEPSAAADFNALAIHFALQDARSRLAVRWARLAEPVGLPRIAALPDPPEPTLLEFAQQFDPLLRWWTEHWTAIERMASSLGFLWNDFRAAAVAGDSPLSPYDRDVALLRDRVQALISHRAAAARSERAKRILGEAAANLAVFDGPVCRTVRDAIARGDETAYEVAFEALRALTAKQTLATRRRVLLERLAPSARPWAEAINRRLGEHGASTVPGDPILAWRWRQLSQEIARRASLDEVALGARLVECQRTLRETTANLIDRKAWLGQKRRVGLAQQQALHGWAQLQRRIGRGTGKRAPALQAQARKELSRAQGAVPVWIMPLARVAEAVDPVGGRFDVVIIDEASQCDLSGLLTWYLADQVVVVGDDKQVSPMAVGQKADRAQDLINQHLHDVPNHQLYDGRTSLYDLAQQAFGGTIRLREHFRCMPDIIGFSNELSYDFEIQPLRNPDAVPAPHVIEHVVAGATRDGKTNVAEAEFIAAAIAAVLERPEYAGKTIGAISLLGDEQAHLIFAKTALVAEPSKLQERQFLAGNSAQFQGDQRHVIFLSMVDSPGDAPHTMRQEEYLKQRYNVAASRARDQIWLVHSLDPARDLKPGDVRKQLIDYVRAPGAREAGARKAAKRAESPFEMEVISRLAAAGYAVEPQVKVGSYRIDMVVRGKGGQVAIECDGARFHPPEKIPEDLARQAILERCGWRFVRIRSTAYFADPDAATARAFEQIRALGVEPDGFESPMLALDSDPLIAAIRRRAWEIMHDQGWVTPIPSSPLDASLLSGSDDADRSPLEPDQAGTPNG
ncbi:MAG: AAA domain-containing protein, partial [Gemmatimonadales bacterium]